MTDNLDGACERDPFAWFLSSLARANQLESFDPTRAALATVSAGGVPSVRFVLVRQVDPRGFVFFTHYTSPKARDLAANPRAALAFHWASLGEQVRVQGNVVRVAESESDAYFASRSRGSQLGAWASEQSEPIVDRALLEARLAEVTRRFSDRDVPRPPQWGGLRVVPDAIEFWRNREHRLHDRFRFTRSGEAWTCVRLQP